LDPKNAGNPGLRVGPSYQLQLKKESQPGFYGITFSPGKFGIETNSGFAVKDLAWRLIRKEPRDWRIEESESKSESNCALRPKNIKP
jgi:hypothetical protein